MHSGPRSIPVGSIPLKILLRTIYRRGNVLLPWKLGEVSKVARPTRTPPQAASPRGRKHVLLRAFLGPVAETFFSARENCPASSPGKRVVSGSSRKTRAGTTLSGPSDSYSGSSMYWYRIL